MLQECSKSYPVVASPLTPAIEPLEQDSQPSMEELRQALIVSHNSIIVVVSTQFGVQPPEQFSQFQVSVLPTPLGETF